jgi:hypothetical protein
MRKVLMIGTAVAKAPYAPAEQVWVAELSAYMLASTSTPELAYVRAWDAVSAGRALELWAQQRMSTVTKWARVQGMPIRWQSVGPYTAPPGPSDVAAAESNYCMPPTAAAYG